MLAGIEARACRGAARAAAGVSRRVLRTARERLLASGEIETSRDGFQGPWRYRLLADVEDDVDADVEEPVDRCRECEGRGCFECERTGLARTVLADPDELRRAYREAEAGGAGEMARWAAIHSAIGRRVRDGDGRGEW